MCDLDGKIVCSALYGIWQQEEATYSANTSAALNLPSLVAGLRANSFSRFQYEPRNISVRLVVVWLGPAPKKQTPCSETWVLQLTRRANQREGGAAARKHGGG